jgi:uncharacterized protein
MFEELKELSQTFITLKFEHYRRYFIERTPLKHRFSIILGERGIGKTTTLIQYLLDSTDQDPLSETILYIQADHFLMGRTTLYEIAETFCRLGGRVIAFDEIHKYPNWSIELKSIYDTFPDLKILASGSSALEIHKGSHDLTRRAIVYRMFGLSLREFIELKYGFELSTYSLEEIVAGHTKLAFNITQQLESKKLKILKLFGEYLEHGYYPYFRIFESVSEFKITVEQNLHTTLESDLVAIYPHLTGNSIKKIKQLITYLAQAVPFTPNWQAIKKMTDIGDDRTLKTYFNYLQDASIIQGLESGSDKMKRIEDPEKIFLANPNQLYAYCSMHPNIGTVRETFFLSSLRPLYNIATARNTDFLVEQLYYFEVGGKNKDPKQLRNNDNSYLALDDIEHGVDRRIPLWLFGFLY